MRQQAYQIKFSFQFSLAQLLLVVFISNVSDSCSLFFSKMQLTCNEKERESMSICIRKRQLYSVELSLSNAKSNVISLGFRIVFSFRCEFGFLGMG